jgi:hypothetical protein
MCVLFVLVQDNMRAGMRVGAPGPQNGDNLINCWKGGVVCEKVLLIKRKYSEKLLEKELMNDH